MYLHGVVETWMLKDLVSVTPSVYASRNHEPVFCEKINKASEDKWLAVVRANLDSMKSGFAASEVMKVLSKRLCK